MLLSLAKEEEDGSAMYVLNIKRKDKKSKSGQKLFHLLFPKSPKPEMELKMLVNSCCGEGCVEGAVRQLKEREQSKLLSPYSTPKGTIVRICKQKKIKNLKELL